MIQFRLAVEIRIFAVAKFEIQLNIPDVKILNIETTKTNDLVITVKSTKKSTQRHKRGQKITNIHEYGEAIMLRHLPILGQSVYIRLRPAKNRIGIIDAVNLQRLVRMWRAY
jgi:hypothetical protein